MHGRSGAASGSFAQTTLPECTLTRRLNEDEINRMRSAPGSLGVTRSIIESKKPASEAADGLVGNRAAYTTRTCQAGGVFCLDIANAQVIVSFRSSGLSERMWVTGRTTRLGRTTCVLFAAGRLWAGFACCCSISPVLLSRFERRPQQPCDVELQGGLAGRRIRSAGSGAQETGNHLYCLITCSAPPTSVGVLANDISCRHDSTACIFTRPQDVEPGDSVGYEMNLRGAGLEGSSHWRT